MVYHPVQVPCSYPDGEGRKSSRGKDGGQGLSQGGKGPHGAGQGLPQGGLHINLVRGKELIKADIIGKSDPYAVLKYGNQTFRTKTVNNSQACHLSYLCYFVLVIL
jgi:hypothetical protein